MARGRPSRRTWWSPTSTSTASSASACTIRAGARRSWRRRDAARRRSSSPARPATARGAGAARRAKRPEVGRGPRRSTGRWCSARRLRAEERVPPGGDGTLGRDRLGAGGRASRSTRSAPTDVTGVIMPSPLFVGGHAPRRGRAGASAWASSFLTTAHHRACSRPIARALAAPFKGLKADVDRGEPPGAHPRQHPDGALEQVRLAGAHDGQQERDRRRLLARSTATWPAASR